VNRLLSSLVCCIAYNQTPSQSFSHLPTPLVVYIFICIAFLLVSFCSKGQGKGEGGCKTNEEKREKEEVNLEVAWRLGDSGREGIQWNSIINEGYHVSVYQQGGKGFVELYYRFLLRIL